MKSFTAFRTLSITYDFVSDSYNHGRRQKLSNPAKLWERRSHNVERNNFCGRKQDSSFEENAYKGERPTRRNTSCEKKRTGKMSRAINDCGCGNKSRKTCVENCKNNCNTANRRMGNYHRGSESSGGSKAGGCGCVAQPAKEKARRNVTNNKPRK